MVPNVVYLKFIASCFLLLSCCCSNFVEVTQDQTSARANTLIDDADDIQKQLDNEARDRIKYGRPKTIWVFHFPTQFPEINVLEKVTRPLRAIKLLRYRAKGNASMSTEGKEGEIEDWKNLKGEIEDWNFSDQENWSKSYPDCGGRSQSPVDLPYRGLIEAHGARQLLFRNYDVMPKSLRLINDGKKLVLFGKWLKGRRPFIYGGAAHSRRYLFHSLTLHWPSEHKVAGLQYPLESQVTFVAAEYGSMKTAMEASVADPLAFLAISSLYKFANHSQEGLEDLIQTATKSKALKSILSPKPLGHFSPPFTEYACYQGSMTAPPCTEAVLWFVRGRTLPVTRELAAAAVDLVGVAEEQSKQFRSVQPINDRRVYFFNNQHKEAL